MIQSAKSTNTPRAIGLKLGLALVFGLAVGNQTQAGTINFGSIADGTSVSSLGPLDGILSISATRSSRHYEDDAEIWQTSDAQIAGGVLAVTPDYSPDADDYRCDLSAAFFEAVTNVSFQLENWRTAGYSYTGIDGTGTEFSVTSYLWGAIENGGDLSWTTITLDMPEGGYITGFSIRNRDGRPSDAAFWIDNISYDTVQAESYRQVPDAGSTFALVSGALTLLALSYRFLGKLPAGLRRG